MDSPTKHQVTQLLQAWSSGDRDALDALIPLVYAELHRLASGYMRAERQGHILQTTALINEAWIQLSNWENVEWKSRAHFLGIAAQVMRRVLVDIARSRGYLKRGGRMVQITLSDAVGMGSRPDLDLIALHEALERLARLDPRQSGVVEMRFFGGMEEKEIAAVLGVSVPTVKRDWRLARLWLLNELEGDPSRDS
ncbi:MAG: sigma-70 family RNA polymerase sigma factor [Acidobacteria bacterium]|nr:sigma-70 family RNA polymerase sigma factor [Acidobacteriota bacterium]